MTHSSVTGNPLIRGAIREAGGIPPLVALLSAGSESEAAQVAASTLYNLCRGGGRGHGRGGAARAPPGCCGADGQASHEPLIETYLA